VATRVRDPNDGRSDTVPLPLWVLRENDETVVHLSAEVDLIGPAALLPQLARRAVKKGVDDNFATLKQILEVARH
jgi:hypothetical protein